MYLLFGPFNTLQHALDGLRTDVDIEGIPDIVNLLIDVKRRASREVIQKGLASATFATLKHIKGHVPPPFLA